MLVIDFDTNSGIYAIYTMCVKNNDKHESLSSPSDRHNSLYNNAHRAPLAWLYMLQISPTTSIFDSKHFLLV